MLLLLPAVSNPKEPWHSGCSQHSKAMACMSVQLKRRLCTTHPGDSCAVKLLSTL